MRVGILGGGNISATHARAAVAAGCRVAAVFGQNQDKAAAIAREHGAVVFDTLDGLVSHRPMDLVAIGSPSGLHAEHISLAARHGLHILVEKPIEISVARVDAALNAVRTAGVRLGVFFQDRLKPDLVRLRHMLSAGDLGRPTLVNGRVKWYRPREYYGQSKWRGTWALDGGGALMNQGIHTIDALLWLLGSIVSVSARARAQVHEIEVEDTLVATLEFASGALGTFEATTAAYPGYPRRIEITGTEGTAIVDGDLLSAIDVKSGTGRAGAAHNAAAAATASQSSPVVSDVSAHRRIFEDFIESLRSGRDPACSGAEGRRSVAVVEAIYQSVRSGQTVMVRRD